MNKIVSKKQLSDNVFQMEVEAALIANERKAGQFIILMIDEALGERIPLTIADADPQAYPHAYAQAYAHAADLPAGLPL